MRKCLAILILFSSFYSYCQTKQTYLEPNGDNRTRFYFNEQYYLVDKDCQFLTIIRVSAINKDKNIFEGDFTDYDLNGKTVLTGTYLNGKKHGTFRSFYPNGFLRWHGQYESDNRSGTWNFYYPDGKPSTILEIKNNRTYVMHSWDNKGKQVIKNGDGKFVLNDYLLGFNNEGYSGFSYSGKVMGGLQDKLWLMEYIFPKNKKEKFYYEMYSNGKLLRPIEYGSRPDSSTRQRKFLNTSRIRLFPTEYFLNSENIRSKKCTIDDNSGFTDYLKHILNSAVILSPPASDDLLPPMEITLDVDEKGKSSRIIISPQAETEFYKKLLELLNGIGYWIPSQINGKVIADTLTIKTEIYVNEGGVPTFSLPLITRFKEK